MRLLFLLISLMLADCRSTGPVTRVTKAGKEIEIYDAGDRKSAIADSKGSRTLAEVIADVRSSLKNDPHDVKALINLANLLLVQGKISDARKVVKHALRFDLKNTDARKALAAVELTDGNLDLATIILNGLGGAQARDSQILNMMGLLSLKLEQYDESLAYFKSALKTNPNDLAVRMNLGVIYLKYRQLPAAKQQFDRVLAIMPEHQDAKLHLAIINAVQGHPGDARRLYQEILAKNDHNALAWYDLAILDKRNSGQLDAALQAVNNYLDTDNLHQDEEAKGVKLQTQIKQLIAERERKARAEKERQSLAAKPLRGKPSSPKASGKTEDKSAKKTDARSDKR